MAADQSETLLRFRIPGPWDEIRAARNQIRLLVREHGPEVESAAAMAVSELLENAFKYGAAVAGQADVRVAVALTAELLELRVSNGVDNPQHVTRLCAHVAETRRRDPESAFMARMEELIRTRGSSSAALGIFRIAAEGRFMLSTDVAHEVVTVVAQRPLGKRGEG